jgi:uncharacterized protein YuzB (UPF0349 family)
VQSQKRVVDSDRFECDSPQRQADVFEYKCRHVQSVCHTPSLAQVTGVQVRVGHEIPEELPEEIPDEFETPQVGNLDVDSKFMTWR